MRLNWEIKSLENGGLVESYKDIIGKLPVKVSPRVLQSSIARTQTHTHAPNTHTYTHTQKGRQAAFP